MIEMLEAYLGRKDKLEILRIDKMIKVLEKKKICICRRGLKKKNALAKDLSGLGCISKVPFTAYPTPNGCCKLAAVQITTSTGTSAIAFAHFCPHCKSWIIGLPEVQIVDQPGPPELLTFQFELCHVCGGQIGNRKIVHHR